jgi:hypothetical protein
VSVTASPRRALADTSVLIDFPAERVGAVADELAVSAISLAELHYGITAATDPVEQLARRRRVQLISDLYEVLVFDAEVAEFYGALAGAVRRTGRNPRPRRMDLQIAATAARHGLDVLTRNGTDFVGLSAMVRVHDLGPSW